MATCRVGNQSRPSAKRRNRRTVLRCNRCLREIRPNAGTPGESSGARKSAPIFLVWTRATIREAGFEQTKRQTISRKDRSRSAGSRDSPMGKVASLSGSFDNRTVQDGSGIRRDINSRITSVWHKARRPLRCCMSCVTSSRSGQSIAMDDTTIIARISTAIPWTAGAN